MRVERYGRTGPFWNGYVDDGYDWMERIEARGWMALADWRGQEIGDWPMVVVAVNDAGRPPWEVAAYAEGSVTLWRCASVEESRELLDRLAAEPSLIWREEAAG